MNTGASPATDALLDYEKLDAYRCSIELLKVCVQLIDTIPKPEEDLRSQLRRASISIPLNIAEGTGKPTAPDRARYYAIARGSAMECGALLDVLAASSLISSDTAGEARNFVVRLVSMLTKLCRR